MMRVSKFVSTLCGAFPESLRKAAALVPTGQTPWRRVIGDDSR